MKDSIIKNNQKVYSAVTIFFMIILWYFVSKALGDPLKVPTPKATVIYMVKILKDPLSYMAIATTIIGTIKALIISIVLALAFGVFAGYNEVFKKLLHPIIIILRATPTMGIIILLLIMFGGRKASIIISFLVIFPIMYSNIIEGFSQIDQDLLEMAQIYTIKPINKLKGIILPSIKPYFLAGVFSSVGLGFKVMISAEVLGEVSHSIGKELFLKKVFLEIDGVFAWLIILIVIVGIFEWGLKKLFNKVGKNYEL